jgi:hypothetical protein
VDECYAPGRRQPRRRDTHSVQPLREKERGLRPRQRRVLRPGRAYFRTSTLAHFSTQRYILIVEYEVAGAYVLTIRSTLAHFSTPRYILIVEYDRWRQSVSEVPKSRRQSVSDSEVPRSWRQSVSEVPNRWRQ